MNKKYALLALTAGIVLALSGCGPSDKNDDTGAGTGEETGTSAYVNQHLPQTVGIDIPKTLLSAAANSTRQLRDIDDGDSSLAYEELRELVQELEDNINERETDFMLIDSVWDQIQNYCTSTPVGTACDIPEGQITMTITEEMRETIVDFIEEVSEDYGVVLTDAQLDTMLAELPAAGTTEPMGAVTFINNPAGIYDYYLQATESELDDGEASTNIYTVKWTQSKDKIEFTDTSTETYGEYTEASTSSLIYSAEADGDSIKMHDTSITSENGITLWEDNSRLTLKELNDGKDGVIITAEFTDNGQGYVSEYNVVGQANDDGGFIKSTYTSNYDGANETWHFKESFNATGGRSGAEECQEVTAGHCDIDANWTAVTGYSDIGSDDDFYLDDAALSEFLDDFAFTVVEVTGLTNSETPFVITKTGSVSPFNNDGDILCFGFKESDDNYGEAFCDVSAATLIETAGPIYEVSFTNEAEVFTESTNANYTVVSLTDED